MIRKSIRSKVPRKPRPDFPLFIHRRGYWAKKVKGQTIYFGKVADDPQGQKALALWLDQKDDRLAGRKPQPKDGRLTVGDCVNAFLRVKETAVELGELTQRSWLDYKATSTRMIGTFGRNRSFEDLRPEDFADLRTKLAKTLGMTTIGNEVQRTRTILKWAYDSGMITAPIRTGPDFKRPSKKVRRRARQAAGPKLFSASEVKAMIEAAPSAAMRAMLLLAINTGMGNSDLASMPLESIDLNRGWHTHGRPKTGVERRCPLWPETIEAVKAAIAKRPKPKAPEDERLLFITKYGQRFIRQPEQGGSKAWVDAIVQETKKLLSELGIQRLGVGFYTLRRTFRTVADESGDQVAVNHIMGHSDSDSDMGAVYRQSIADERLQRVVDHVHAWLYPTTAEGGAE